MGDLRMLSIDPGEVHNGTALWYGDKCVEVEEYGPGALFLKLEGWLREQSLDIVVIEEFKLYPNKAADQVFSQFKTVEVIGVIRYLVARWGMTIPLIEQPALIKKPTRGQMRARGIVNEAVKQRKGPHCADAVLHGAYFIHYSNSAPTTEVKP